MIYQSLRVIKTKAYGEYQDITPILQEEIEKSGQKNGIVLVCVLHTTAAVTLQEPDPDVHRDGIDTLNDVVPENKPYQHIYEGQINAVAHQKQMLIGNARVIPFRDRHLVLGTWQRVYLIELFHGMPRKAFITLVGE